MRLLFVLAVVLSAGAVRAEDGGTARLVDEGADFCFRRGYDAAHRATHPRQLVTSMKILGRNAWRGPEGHSSGLVATAVVTFADRKTPLDLYGRCHEPDGSPGSLRCAFVPGAFQDVLGQTIVLERAGPAVKATASSDWLVVRAGREPDGVYGPPKSDDRVFLLERSPIAACAPSPALWSERGARPALRERLP